MAPSQHQTVRHLATSSRVHPSYLPYLQAPRPPKSAKWIPPAVALAGIGYGVSVYRQSKRVQHETASARSATKAETEKMQREMLQDAYGDRDSLESLEAAIRVYEEQRR